MKFIKSDDSQVGEQDLLNYLNVHLASGKNVLWLVSGGSNIPITIRVLSELREDLTANLELLLCDERYVEVGSTDSNFQSFTRAGLSLKRAKFEPILVNGLSPKQTLDRYYDQFDQKRNWADRTIAQLGIGNDGHTAGILPGTEAVNSLDEIVYYEAAPFKRLSLTLQVLTKLDELFVFAYGASKQSALERLKNSNEPLQTLPSAIFRGLSNVKVYNDQIGD